MAEISLAVWTLLLRLPDYEVLHCQAESDLNLYRFTVGPRQRIAVCPHCGRSCDQVHQTRTRAPIKDLPISNFAVELKVRVPQYQCPRCQQCFTPAVPFLFEGAHATTRFLERAAVLVRTSDIANAAAFLGVPERTLADWYYDYLQRRAATATPKLQPIRHIGIDELSLKKSTDSSSP
jgi:transposase